MSLINFQTAIARMARLPDLDTDTALQSVLSAYELSDAEKASLTALAFDRELKKHADGLLDMRWSMMKVRVPLLLRYVNADLLYEIYRVGFDPTCVNIPNRELSYQFLEFISVDEGARCLIASQAPEFIGDLIKFEREQARMKLDQWYGLGSPLPDSPLTTNALYLLALEWDVAAYLQALEQTPINAPEQPTPSKRKNFILMIPAINASGYRLFEIEYDVYEYLRACLVDSRFNSIQKPHAYPSLQKLRLVR